MILNSPGIIYSRRISLNMGSVWMDMYAGWCRRGRRGHCMTILVVWIERVWALMMSVWEFKEYRLVALIYLISSIDVERCMLPRDSRG